MNNYDFKTKCRALFVSTISMIKNESIELDVNFFISINTFIIDTVVNNPTSFELLQYIAYYTNSHGKINIYENDKTIEDLFRIIDSIKSYNDLKPIYDELGFEITQKITLLAELYIDYLNEFDRYPTLKE